MYHFFCYTANNNPINRPEEAFSTLQGISKHYHFLVKKHGAVYMRQRSCYCLSCMAELMDGTLTWGAMHRSHAKVASLTANELNSDTNLCCFDKCECAKTSGPGVVAELQNKNKSRKELAS